MRIKSFVITLFLRQLVHALVLVPDQSADDDKGNGNNVFRMFNFASQAAGAIILDQSPSTAKGFNNLLNNDKDKYGISPCSENKWVVIGLSEDILVTSVVMANYEKYSSMLKDFQVLASTSYPTDQWIDLGTYKAEPILGEQTFNISQMSSAHTRYIKIKFKTHYLDEALCTLSQVKVHGMTVIASLHEEVERESYHVRDVLHDLNMDANGSEIENDASVEDAIIILSSNSTIESNSTPNKSTEESSDRAITPEVEPGPEPSKVAATLSESALPTSDKNISSNSSSGLDTPVAEIDKEKDATVDRNSKRNEEMLPETIDLPQVVNPATDMSSTKSEDRNDVIQPDTAEVVKPDGESEDSITPVSTTDNLIALCETMSTIPSTDSIFQEVVQFMRSSDSEVSQQQKDDTAASIIVALKSLLGIGGELRTLPLAQPKILIAAVRVVKGIFSPLIKSLTAPDSSVKESTTLPETDSITTTTPCLEDNSNQIKTESSDGEAKSERIIATNETSSSLTSSSETSEISASSAAEEDIGDLMIATDIAASSLDHHKAEYITMDVGSNHSLIEINGSIMNSEETDNVSVSLAEAAKKSTVSDVNISGIISLIQNLSTTPASQAPPVVKLINMSAVNSADEVNYIQQENALPFEDTIGDPTAKIEPKPLAFTNESIGSTTNESIAILTSSEDNIVNAETISAVFPQIDSDSVSKGSDANATTSHPSTQSGHFSSVITAVEKLNLTTTVNISSMGPIFEKPNLTCFETLNYTEFHSKMKTKLQIKGGTMSESSQEVSKDNNVFKAMMQRIKHLEMNDAIVEMFTNQMVDCYRTITREYLKTSDLDILTAQLEKSLISSRREASAINAPIHQNQHQHLLTSVGDQAVVVEAATAPVLEATNSTVVEPAPNVLILLNDSATAPATDRQRKTSISDSAEKMWSFDHFVHSTLQHIVRVLRDNGIETSGDFLLVSESFLSFLEKNSIFICLCSLFVTVLSLCTSVMCLIVMVLMFISRVPKR